MLKSSMVPLTPGFAAVVLLDESHVSAHYSDRGFPPSMPSPVEEQPNVEELKQALYELSPTTVLMQQKALIASCFPRCEHER